MNTTVKLGIIAVIVFGLIFGVVSLTKNWGKNKDTVNTETSVKKLNDLYGKLNISKATPKKDPDFSSDNDDLIAVLPDISEYPFIVNPTTDNFLTIYASPEKENWLIDIAEKFNKSGATADGNPVSVGIRSIQSGLGADFISSGKYKPDLYAPSSELYGDMLTSKGIKINVLEKRTAGNVAGIVLSKKKYESLNSPNAQEIIEFIVNGKVEIGYTNPTSNSEGLNFLITALYTFDANNPLGDTAVSQLRKFQDKIPYVAYDATQLKESALSGTLDGFVSDYQAFAASPELKSSYLFIPFGVRHDQPVYGIGELSALKKQIAVMFVDYCKTPSSQKSAADNGFNGLEDYAYSLPIPDGITILQAQETWKKEKNGTSDLTAVFVADISGSMEGSPLLKLKASLNRAATFIDSNTNVGLITFSDNVNIALPIGKFDNNQKAYFSSAVKSMQAGGGTAMFDAVIVAQKMLIDAQERNPNTKLMLFVLTDGETNRGYSFRDVENVTRGLRIPIYTIGYNADIEVLQNLSNINEAKTINAETEDVIYKLQSLFNAQM